MEQLAPLVSRLQAQQESGGGKSSNVSPFMGMMSCCRALTKCKYRWPVGQLQSNFPRGINFTAPGASAAVLQHVIPLAGLDGDGIPGNLGEIDTINPTGGSSTTEPVTGSQGRSLMATNTWPGGLGGLTQLLIPPMAPKAGTKISDASLQSPRNWWRRFAGGSSWSCTSSSPSALQSQQTLLGRFQGQGKEEAQRHKCMATVFCPLRGGLGLLKASTGPRPDGIHDLHNQGQPGVWGISMDGIWWRI